MNTIKQGLNWAKSLEMHILFRTPIQKMPPVVLLFLLQVFFSFGAVIVFPENEESMRLILKWYMFTVNALFLVLLGLFVTRVSISTFIANKQEREQMRNQYALKMGDVSQIESIIAPDIMVAQYETETADEFRQRISSAIIKSSKSVYVVVIPRRSHAVLVYGNPLEQPTTISRRVLPWEIEIPAEERIVSEQYNFISETPENFAIWCSRFAQKWPEYAAEQKIINAGQKHGAAAAAEVTLDLINN